MMPWGLAALGAVRQNHSVRAYGHQIQLDAKGKSSCIEQFIAGKAFDMQLCTMLWAC